MLPMGLIHPLVPLLEGIGADLVAEPRQWGILLVVSLQCCFQVDILGTGAKAA